MSHRRCVLPNYVIAFQSFCFSLKNNKQVIRNWLADRLLTTWISFQQLNSHNFIAIYLRKMKKLVFYRSSVFVFWIVKSNAITNSDCYAGSSSGGDDDGAKKKPHIGHVGILLIDLCMEDVFFGFAICRQFRIRVIVTLFPSHVFCGRSNWFSACCLRIRCEFIIRCVVVVCYVSAHWRRGIDYSTTLTNTVTAHTHSGK